LSQVLEDQRCFLLIFFLKSSSVCQDMIDNHCLLLKRFSKNKVFSLTVLNNLDELLAVEFVNCRVLIKLLIVHHQVAKHFVDKY